MTEVVASEPQTLVQEMLRTAASQVLIRTVLSIGPQNYGHFSSDIFMAEGRTEGTVERLLKIQAHHGTSQIPTRLCGLDIVSGEHAPRVMGKWIAAMALRNPENSAPWFSAWLTKDSFAGILLISTDYRQGPTVYRRVPAHHPAFQVYFGAISAGLSLLAAERRDRGLSQEERTTAEMLNRLAERFGRFMWAQERHILESIVGKGIE